MVQVLASPGENWASLVARAASEHPAEPALQLSVPAAVAKQGFSSASSAQGEVVMAAALAGLLLAPSGVVEGADGALDATLQRPGFEQGAKLAIPTASKAAAAAPRVMLDLGGDDDDLGFAVGGGDLVDEDALLEDEDLVKPPTEYDCGPSAGAARKACKNCTCGLAEEEAAGEVVVVKTEAQASACGNCYLGDAFRCATCPSRGKPAFKPGQENVQLDLTDDF